MVQEFTFDNSRVDMPNQVISHELDFKGFVSPSPSATLLGTKWPLFDPLSLKWKKSATIPGYSPAHPCGSHQHRSLGASHQPRGVHHAQGA